MPHLSGKDGEQLAWQFREGTGRCHSTAQGTAHICPVLHPARHTLSQHSANVGSAMPELPKEQAEPTGACLGELLQQCHHLHVKQPI